MKRILIVLALIFSVKNADAQKYYTTWRLFFNPTGASAVAPGHIDYRVVDLAVVYKNFGVGTKGFRVIHNADFSSDSVALAGFIAPAYIYFVPFAAHRKSFEITPWVTYMYAGFSAWGFKNGMLIDFGAGVTHYFLSFRLGFNALRTDSRLFFNIDDPGFNDFPINWKSIYLSFDLFPGYWMSLKAKRIDAEIMH
ncbi:MAG: hypothetical protein N3A65_07605 [candidate division WOR-3 bacterium]|nr:hypothetical protein [candidate division WOR-3 bacterium]